MNTFFANKSHFRDNKAYIDGEDYHHIKNVLRMKTGEDAYICDDDENKYLATLASFTDKEAEFYIISKCERVSELPVDITLYQGLPRQERFELVIQKSSECHNPFVHMVFHSKHL